MHRTRSLRLALAAVLFALYVVPVFAPPPPQPLWPAPMGAGLTERVFPGVPGWWVWGRLAALFLGALLAGWGHGRCVRAAPPWSRSPSATRSGPLWGLAAVAWMEGLWAFRAAAMSKPEQLTFVAALAAPAALAWLLYRKDSPAREPIPWKAISLVIGVWAVTWWPVMWRSPWIASFVDQTSLLGLLTRSRDPNFNFVTYMPRPGQSALYLTLEGGGLIEWLGITPSTAYLQVVDGVWLVAAAVAVGVAAARLLSPALAPLAAAALLASPFAKVESLMLAPLAMSQFFISALVVCAALVADRRSVVAMVAAGLFSGWAATFPYLTPLACPGLLFVIVVGLRRPRIPAPAILAALGSFAAFVAPLLPSLRGLTDAYAFYAAGTAEWATMQNAFFGQLDPAYVQLQMQAAQAGRFDALAGSLLAPFVTARTGLRLWGDTILEPCGVVLATLGLIYAIRRPSVRSLGLVAMLVLASAGGGISGYDRASLLRIPALVVPMALLTALGSGVLEIRRLGAVTAAAVALLLSGWVIMVKVNPRILARSATTISLESIRAVDIDRAAVLAGDFQSSPTYLNDIPASPLRWIAYRAAGDLAPFDAPGAPSLLLWSPSVEERGDVGDAICARWPDARFFVITDAAGLSRAFAARTGGPPWEPNVDPWRWQSLTCPVALPTEGRSARAAIARARELTAQAREEEAIQVLRGAARASVLQWELYAELAKRLLTGSGSSTGGSTAQIEEAEFWARRATTVSGYCAPGPAGLLRRILGVRRDSAALARLDKAEQDAQALACANLPADHPLRRPRPGDDGLVADR